MKSCNRTTIFVFLSLFLSIIGGCAKDDNLNTLIVNTNNLQFAKEGSSASITIETDADAWSINNPASDWLLLSTTSGKQKTATITLSVTTKTITSRTDTLIISAGNALPVKVVVSQASSEFIYSLGADRSYIKTDRIASSVTMEVLGDAAQWTLTSDVDWVKFNPATGTGNIKNVIVSILRNEGTAERTAKITLKASGAPTATIPVTQRGDYYPNYNLNPLAPDAVGMSSSASQLAAKLKIGWNIGNTLEAIGGETAWGNPKVTEDLIKLVKQNGFNAIRIPCSWFQYMENSSTAKIKGAWLERVKQVIQYCVQNDVYVLLNIHWDGGWLEKNCTVAKQEEVNAMQKAYWEQIATYMRDFDEHLILASANEPDVQNAAQMAVLKSYHQTFINAVRSTGGKNSYRVLVVQGPSTDIEKTNTLMNSLPTDVMANKMMVEIHYYSPYQFCLMDKDASWGKMFYYWGNGNHSTTDIAHNATWGEEVDVDRLFKLMKTQFTNRGIPVIMGEYAVIKRTNLTGDDLKLHLASRAYYLKYVTKQAIANGIIPFYWDAGNMGENASALFNRSNNTVFDKQALDSIIEGATK